MTDPIPDPPPGFWEQTEQLMCHERELWAGGHRRAGVVSEVREV